jgi:hypothetical protein
MGHSFLEKHQTFLKTGDSYLTKDSSFLKKNESFPEKERSFFPCRPLQEKADVRQEKEEASFFSGKPECGK